MMIGKNLMRPVEVLLVDDSVDDVELMKEALKDAKINLSLNEAYDGVQAMDFLKRRNGFERAARPDLVLLDLNMPRKDGREVLAEIKRDPELGDIPVVILTTSKSDEDILATYKLHANCYITKPVDFDEFIKVVRSIENFWLTVVMLPAAE